MHNQPRGFFQFKSGNTEIKGRVCTWSLNRFCEKRDIPNVNELFQIITTGVSIVAIAEILLCAVEYSNRAADFKYTIDDAMDWIDDMGGLVEALTLISSHMVVEAEKTDSKKKKRNV
jgi:hypothetical protein